MAEKLSVHERAQYKWIANANRRWKRTPVRRHALAVSDQPWDTELLAGAKLYRTSRKLYLQSGGVFRPALQSSARALGSASLLENLIEYSPIDSELQWALSAPRLEERESVVLQLRRYATSLFHEQNHRVLWSKILPAPPPRVGPELYLYLNFAESLVVMLDDALADSLPVWQSSAAYTIGTLYGAPAKAAQLCKNRRHYRNYLHACAYSTYLTLGHYPESDSREIIQKLFSHLGPLAERAWIRSSALDAEFVGKTNPVWQARNARATLNVLRAGRAAQSPLRLPIDPIDNREAYLLTERTLDLFGL